MAESGRLAFKAYEIEELADVYFFRPLGMVLARAARALSITPTAVTVAAAIIGVVGGAMVSADRYAVLAFLLLMIHAVLDSSDGQLARMTGTTSEFGRLLDGLSGYATHAAVYIALLVSALATGRGVAGVVLILAAAASNVVHAQMYDYHRSSYVAYAIDGRVPPSPDLDARDRASVGVLLSFYRAIQRSICGLHAVVEASIARRASGDRLRDDDQGRYRRLFYWPVRGWNLLGDNTRFYAIGVLAWFHRIDLFPLFVVLPMNAALLALWLWQAWRDREFLAADAP